MTDYLPYLTSSVGLVSCRTDNGVNVMAAEWSYFVAREPLHIMVASQTSNWTSALLKERAEFSITLCDSSQAALAQFVGSFSGAEVDKVASSEVRLEGPHVLGTPHVHGGVLNAECRIVETVELPGYTLFIGECLWVQVNDVRAGMPLVKHGHMYELGPRIATRRVVASVTRLPAPDAELSVAAAVQGVDVLDGDRWRVAVFDARSGEVLVNRTFRSRSSTLRERIGLPSGVSDGELLVRVERDGCGAGECRVGDDRGAGPSASRDLR